MKFIPKNFWNNVIERTNFDQSTSFGPEEVVWPNNVLSKFVYFKRSLIWKNVQKQRFSKERHSKEKIEFRKNVIRSIDLVPSLLVFYITLVSISTMVSFNSLFKNLQLQMLSLNSPKICFKALLKCIYITDLLKVCVVCWHKTDPILVRQYIKSVHPDLRRPVQISD